MVKKDADKWRHKHPKHYLPQIPDTHRTRLEEASHQKDTARVALGVHRELYTPHVAHRSYEPSQFDRLSGSGRDNAGVRAFVE